MSLLTIILASLAALEHLYIFYLESIRTTSDTTSRVFNMDKEELARPSVTSLFKNQGIYNALIGVFSCMDCLSLKIVKLLRFLCSLELQPTVR